MRAVGTGTFMDLLFAGLYPGSAEVQEQRRAPGGQQPDTVPRSSLPRWTFDPLKTSRVGEYRTRYVERARSRTFYWSILLGSG